MTTAAAPSTHDAETPGPSAPGTRVGIGDAWAMLIAGAVGLLASLALTAEKIRLLADPAYVPSCNINPVLSCGSVMATEQASLLDLPNSLVGVVAFTVVSVSGLLAVTKVTLPRWYWRGLTIGVLAGVGFVHWLIFVSLHRIGSLCPYCMVVWAVTVPLLVVVAPLGFDPGDRHPAARVVHRWRWSLTALWFTALTVAIGIRFQDYWSTLI